MTDQLIGPQEAAEEGGAAGGRAGHPGRLGGGGLYLDTTQRHRMVNQVI